MIPKTLHIIWVGDETRRPDNCIQTWYDHNPEWNIRIWGNKDLAEYGWVNAHHMKAMYGKELNGVADLMRWEILYNEGGFVVDADSICVRPLEDWLLGFDCFACWENELVRPNLVAAGYVGATVGNAFMGQIILDLQAQESVVYSAAWETVGPLFLTCAFRKYQYNNLTILPSHFFIPRHYSGAEYTGGGLVFAKQAWASTNQSYDNLYLRSDFTDF
jgi:mannosyltransferase OCH1-like enzyme